MGLYQDKVTCVVALQTDAQAYLLTKYPQFTIQQLKIIYDEATLNGLTNRALYIKPFMTWIITLMCYVSSRGAAIVAAADEDALSVVTWSFATIDASDPAITIAAALAIST